MFRPLPCVRVKKWGRGGGASVLSDLTPNPEFLFWPAVHGVWFKNIARGCRIGWIGPTYIVYVDSRSRFVNKCCRNRRAVLAACGAVKWRPGIPGW